MPKNIAIFSDGTGQAGGLPGAIPTNVYRLFEACPVVPETQQTYYEPGVGSPRNRMGPRRWRRFYNFISRITGLGITRNIIDCYDAIIQLYEPGDHIFLFGFSRGAYTVRSLAGVISLCGIPQLSPHQLDLRKDSRARRNASARAVRYVYQTYGGSASKRRERKRRGEEFARQHASYMDGASPYFIGVWDTVRAIGLPGVSPLIFWRHKFHDAGLDPHISYARQALSIDENRSAFFPELWDELDTDRPSGRIKQFWFPGVHSDVGGGYQESELADMSLDWMVKEATALPYALIVNRTSLNLRPSYRGMQHDERRGMGFFWRRGTREEFQTRELAFEDSVGKRLGESRVPTVYGEMPYRPVLLAQYPAFLKYYQAIDARRRGLFRRLAASKFLPEPNSTRRS